MVVWSLYFIPGLESGVCSLQSAVYSLRFKLAVL